MWEIGGGGSGSGKMWRNGATFVAVGEVEADNGWRREKENVREGVQWLWEKWGTDNS